MKIGVLGSGMVGRALAGKLALVGHDVAMGTRDVEVLAASEGDPMRRTAPFSKWHAENPRVDVRTFAEAAAHGDVVINATAGAGALEALALAGAANLGGKILMDVSNPLDFSKGFPPTLSISNDDSLGEQVQAAFPDVRVVKTLNTVSAVVMVDPGEVAGGDHDVFVSGNDEVSKASVIEYLKEWFGWTQVIDLGDITTARGTEMYLPLWVRLMGVLGTPAFNIKIAR